MQPAPAVLRESPTAVTGHGSIEHGEFAHRLRIRGGEAKGNRAAPVVADQKIAFEAEMVVREHANVVRNALLIVSRCRPRRVAQAAQIGRDHLIARGQTGDDMAPFIPGLRPPMQQHDGKSGPGGDVVQIYVTEVGVMVCDPAHPSLSRLRDPTWTINRGVRDMRDGARAGRQHQHIQVHEQMALVVVVVGHPRARR